MEAKEEPRCFNDPGSFRDRNGRVICIGEEIYRGLSSQAFEDWERLRTSKFFDQCINEKK